MESEPRACFEEFFFALAGRSALYSETIDQEVFLMLLRDTRSLFLNECVPYGKPERIVYEHYSEAMQLMLHASIDRDGKGWSIAHPAARTAPPPPLPPVRCLARPAA